MVRKATENDAEQLAALNDEFNGAGETTIDSIIADPESGIKLLCVQLKKSFCYDDYMPEITEVYVRPAYRNRGIAGHMISFAEDYCCRNYPLHKYELLTGTENLIARSLYNKLGYHDDGELHLSKRISR